MNSAPFSYRKALSVAALLFATTGLRAGDLYSSTDAAPAAVVLPKAGAVIYSPETYFSRGTRGVRTDVVTVYDAARLQPNRNALQILRLSVNADRVEIDYMEDPATTK